MIQADVSFALEDGTPARVTLAPSGRHVRMVTRHGGAIVRETRVSKRTAHALADALGDMLTDGQATGRTLCAVGGRASG